MLLDESGAVLAERRVETPLRAPALLATFAALVGELEGADPDPDSSSGGPMPVGFGLPGLVGPDGTLSSAPHLEGVANLAVLPALAALLPGRRLVVDNDATAAAVAELGTGAARGARDVLVVTLGTGIGGALVVDGAVRRGAHGFAGEIGHMVVDRDGLECSCGQRGCWETLASGTALGLLARRAVAEGAAPGLATRAEPGGAVRGEHVTEAAAGGDPGAMLVLRAFAEQVAIGLANLVLVTDPELVVLGGGPIGAGEVLLAPLREALAARLLPSWHRPEVPVLAAAHGERAGAVGAALLAGWAGTPATWAGTPATWAGTPAGPQGVPAGRAGDLPAGKAELRAGSPPSSSPSGSGRRAPSP